MDLSKLKTDIQRIATDPKSFWASHKVGAIPASQTLTMFLGPLALLAGIAQFIKFSVIGISVPLVGTVRAPFFSGLMGILVSTAMALVSYYIGAIIMNKIAPKFGGSISVDGALEFMALAGSVALVGSVLTIIPFLGWLVIFGAAIYSIYIFWIGVPSQTGVSESQRIGFVAVTVVAMFVFGLVAAFIRGAILGV